MFINFQTESINSLGAYYVHLVDNPILRGRIHAVKQSRPSHFSGLQSIKQKKNINGNTKYKVKFFSFLFLRFLSNSTNKLREREREREDLDSRERALSAAITDNSIEV